MRSYSVDKPIIIKAHALKYFTNLASHQPLQKRTIPRLAPPHLPPLSKVRCCRPIKFWRRPEGLPHHHSSPRTNPSKTAQSIENRHHPCLMNALFVLRPAKLRAFNFGHPCPSLVKGEVLSPDKIRATTGGIVIPPFLASHQPIQNCTIPTRFS